MRKPSHESLARIAPAGLKACFADFESIGRKAIRSTDPRNVLQQPRAEGRVKGARQSIEPRQMPEIGHEPFNLSPAELEQAWELAR